MRRLVVAFVCGGVLVLGVAGAGAATAPRSGRAARHVMRSAHRRARRRHHHHQSARLTVPATRAALSSAADALLLGNRSLESVVDDNAAGSAEAFPFVAAVGGSALTVSVYVDGHSRASSLAVGLYGAAGGHPGRLLASGSLASPRAGAWNAVAITATPVSSGTTYWLSVLGRGGALYFRDRANGPCVSENSAQGSLKALPASWTSGATWNTCPISAYVTGTADSPTSTTGTGSSGTGSSGTGSSGTGSSGTGSSGTGSSGTGSSGTGSSGTGSSGTGSSGTGSSGTGSSGTGSSGTGSTGSGGAGSGTSPAGAVGAPGPAVSCTTTLNPGQNVSDAVTSAAAGSVVCLNAGNWGNVSISSPMNPATPVTLAATPGQTVAIGDFSTDAQVQNLTVQGFHATSFNVDAASNGGITFQYDTVENVAKGIAFELYSAAHGNTSGMITGVTMQYNQIDHVGQCLADVYNQQNTTFSHNVCGPGIGFGATRSTDPGHYIETGGEDNLTVDNNAFLGPACACAGPAGLHLNVMHDWGDSTNVSFDNNVLWHVDSIGQSLLFQSGHFDNVHIDNNLSVDDPNSGSTSYAFWSTDAHGLSFVNNTVVYSYWGNLLTISQVSNDYPAGSGTGYTIQGNVVTNTADGSDMAYQECQSSCVVGGNVTDDGSAPGPGSVTNWSPRWQTTTWTPTQPWTPVPAGYYQPAGLSMAAGYQGLVGP